MVPCRYQCRLGPSSLGRLRGWGEVRTSYGLRISQHAYLKRLIPSPTSHCGRWTLILCAGTLDPQMHRCVSRIKVMATLLLSYPHVLEYGCRHFVARQLAILFRLAVASTPRSPSTEATKVYKCQRCWGKPPSTSSSLNAPTPVDTFQVSSPNETW